MARFILNLSIFAAIQIAVLTAILTFSPHLSNQYHAAIIDKHRRAESLTGRRVLLAGGSGVALGFDSEILADRVGYQPVNLGVNAQFGLDYILNEVEALVRQGDVIILSPEYLHFRGDATGESLLIMLRAQPANILYVDPSKTKILLDTALFALREILRASVRQPRIYARDGFNPYGDLASYHDQPATYVPESDGWWDEHFDPEYAAATIERINQMAARCRTHGATVLFHYPVVARSRYERDPDAMENLFEQLQDNLTLPTIGDPHDNIYSDELIFDFAYHLTLAGKRKRTTALTEELTALLEEQR